MKTNSTFASLLLCVFVLIPFARAQTNSLTVLLQQGLFEEQANRNLDAAIADYTSLAAQFEKDRQLAATAVFRLGECYRALGKTNEAAAQYQRILRDFSDEQMLATLSRQNLTGMAKTETAAAENFDGQLWSKLKDMPRDELEKILPTVVPDAAFTILFQKRNEAEATLAQMQVNFSPEHPEVLKQKTLLDTINKQLASRIDGILAGLKMRAEISPTSPVSKRVDLMDLNVPTTSEEDQEIARIQQMIQNSPDLINARVDGRTPLARAAASGWLKVATYLMDHGAEVKGSYALSSAVEVGNRAMVELLLSRGADVNEMDNSSGRTLLQTAVQKGYQSVAEVLLANKADVNAQAVSGDTALTTAASVGQVKIMKMLLAAGANPNAANNNGRTPLSFAAERGPMETVKLLLDAKADPNGGKLDAPLLCAIYKHDVASAELLLQAGANPNAVGEIDLPVRPNTADFINHSGHLTPMWLAIYMKQLPLVQLFLKFKTDPNDSQTDGRSLLFSALSDTNILEALLDAGAKVDVHDETVFNSSQIIKQTPLDSAVDQNNAVAVELLLKHGANPDMQDVRGNTALHWAAYRLADENVFRLLLDYKANPNVRGNESTPLDLVKRALQYNYWGNRFGNSSGQNVPAEQKELAEKLIALLRQHGALDKLPDWDRITVSRPSANFSQTVFQKGTNDWNQFTLLETICNFDQNDNRPDNPLAFADLSHVVVVRPSTDGAKAKRIEVNLLNATNGVDCAKDIPLEFGDVVEIPEREHTLAEPGIYLPKDQFMTIFNYLRSKAGEAKLIVAGGQTIQLPLQEFFCRIGEVLTRNVARGALTSNSDLSRVKVTRRDAKTGKSREWIVDCRQPEPLTSGLVPSGTSGTSGLVLMAPISYQWMNGPNNSLASSDLWLRDGDVIEVPEKP